MKERTKGRADPYEAARIHQALLDNQLYTPRRLEAPDTGMRRGGRLRAIWLLDGGRDGRRVPFLPRDHPRRPRPESRQIIRVNPNRSFGRLFKQSHLFQVCLCHSIISFRIFVHILVTDANQRDFYHCMAAKYPV